MNRDITLEKIPKGESPYILNATPSEDYGTITNEKGTTVDITLPSGYNVIGTCLLDDSRQVLFCVNGTLSAIYIKERNTYNTIVAPTTLLGFKVTKQIEAVFKRNYKGEYIIYWTDNFNEPRWLNINSPLTLTVDNIAQINIFNSYTIPIFSLDAVDLGGSLKSGVYQFFVQYEDTYGNRTNYTGASNLVPVTPSTSEMKPYKYSGAAPNTATNKKISMKLFNVDTNYSKIYIVAQFYNNGIAETPKQFAELTIQGASLDFEYTGNENTTNVDANEILSLYAKYSTAKSIVSFGNNLYLGNLSSNPDLGLQKFVNSITVDYELHQTNIANNSSSFNNEVVIYNNKGFMQDDVYALYISYILKDGTQTKAYHIPGRIKQKIGKYNIANRNVYEEDLISSVKAAIAYPAERSLPDNVLDEAIAVSSDAKWFQFFGTEDNAAVMPWGSSNLGYWENQNEIYPDDTDWDIYTLDSNGEPIYRDTLRNEKIRHHKMPEPEIQASGNSKYLNSNSVGVTANIVGLRIKNIPIPASVKDKVSGYKIYYAKKDQKNTLVLAQDVTKFNAVNNYSSPLAYCSTGGNFELRITTVAPPPFDKFRIVDAKSFRLHDFNCLKNNLDISTASWVKNIGTLGLKTTYAGSDADVIATYGDYTNIIAPSLAVWANTLGAPAEYIRRIKTSFYLPANTPTFVGNKNTYNTSYDVYNRGGDSSIFVEVYNNFATTQGVIANQTQSLSFVTATPWNYGLLVNVMAYITDIHNSFDNQELVEAYYNSAPTSPTTYTISNSVRKGDTFFGINTYRVTTDFVDLPAYGLSRSFEVRYGYTVPHLSRANILYRHQGPLSTDMYFPKTNYTADPAMWVNGGTGILEIASTFDNYRGYNNDYSRGNTIYQPEIIQKGLSSEATTFTTRIIRSNTASTEEVSDSFRQFPILSYVDLDKDRGQIEILKKDNTSLVIGLTNALVKTIAREVLKTENTTAYLGSGDIFQIPAREIRYSDTGYGGIQSQWAAVTTPYGLIYPDMKNRRMMMLADSFTDISSNGMRLFCNDKMELKLKLQFPTISMSTDNPANPLGIGYTATWDNTNRRYIITKRDYTMNSNIYPSFIGEYATYPSVTLGNIIFYTPTQSFQRYTLFGWVDVPFTDNTVWIDESFTLSYYPELQSWFSFHSYVPHLYMYDQKNFWGIVNNTLWKHDSGTRGLFYNTQYQTVIDIPFNEQGNKSKIFDSVQYISKYSVGNVEYPDRTYDSFNIYSSTGLSGETALINNDTTRSVNSTWFISNFRDMRANYNTPILDDWNIVGTVNLNKEDVFRKRFIDNYIVLRLITENTENQKLSLVFNSAKARIKER